MNISKEIKKQRTRLSLSQEELAEKVYVTRQTISSWENDKSYPDVHSLIFLSKTFEITIDQLVKGDWLEMERVIEGDDVRKMKLFSTLAIIGFIVCIILFALSIYLGSIILGVITGLIYVIGFTFGIMAIKIKKRYDLRTYRELIAFKKGATLDEILQIRERESGKFRKKYQIVLLVLVVTVFGAILGRIYYWIWTLAR